jgi:hypothetical protein
MEVGDPRCRSTATSKMRRAQSPNELYLRRRRKLEMQATYGRLAEGERLIVLHEMDHNARLLEASLVVGLDEVAEWIGKSPRFQQQDDRQLSGLDFHWARHQLLRPILFSLSVAHGLQPSSEISYCNHNKVGFALRLSPSRTVWPRALRRRREGSKIATLNVLV